MLGLEPAFVAALPRAPNQAEQVYADLDALNGRSLNTWLTNALALIDGRAEAAVLHWALDRVDGNDVGPLPQLGAPSAKLDFKALRAVGDAAVRLGLADRRDALLDGLPNRFISSLALGSTSAGQVLSDLSALSWITLADGSAPLAKWLDNAARLAAGTPEAETFRQARATLA